MNNIQQEQLFTNLTATQAETIAGGDPPGDPTSQYGAPSRANASYGYASARFKRYTSSLFRTRIDIGDKAKDGYAVYAVIQGKTNDGRILSFPADAFHRGGAGTSGRAEFDVNFAFFGNVDIRRIWVAICRENPGKDLYVQGNWIYY